MTQWGFYFDQQGCVGCHTCAIACRDWHNLGGEVSWRRVIRFEDGFFPEPTLSYVSTACHHCANPPCVPACPLDIICKREADGIVVIDSEQCIGCMACMEACPYDALQFDGDHLPRVSKCCLCIDRLVLGKDPVCVASCPVRALDAGPIDVLAAKYGGDSSAKELCPAEGPGPAIIVRPRQFPWNTK